MRYKGSKLRISNEILSVILKDRKSGQWYIEPFAGGMNVIDKVKGNRIANDNNIYLIAMWRTINFNYPERISRELYSHARDMYYNRTTKIFSDGLIGWIGFMGSANGRFFSGGYSGKSITRIGIERDYIKENIKNIRKQMPYMKGVLYFNVDYQKLNIPKNSIIYCDIPYKNAAKYETSKNFKHNFFWDWAREKSLEGHKVYVSEYAAPDDFVCIWKKEIKSSLSANGISGGNKISTEKLFVYKYQK